MVESISKTEKSDILLALALALEEKQNGAGARDAFALTEKYFSALSAEDGEIIKARAEYFDRLPPEKREIWLKIRLDKIRRRGLSERLDANVHPQQIAEILKLEPPAIRLLVLKNLPAALSRKISENLKTKISESDFSNNQTNLDRQIKDEIVALIRRKFVSNFAALEDIFEPAETDKIPVQKLNDFIHHLGIRETAIACRGINSKETLAAFLNRFDEENAKEIAKNITELERVKPVWVERADRLLRKNLENQFQPEMLLRSLGYKILSLAYVRRDVTAKKYTAQKMTPFDAENWLALVAESEREYETTSDEERHILERRKRIIERLAAKFV